MTRELLLTIVVLSGLSIESNADQVEAIGPMPSPTAQDRILLVAAHNDDEAIAGAGYLAAAARAGAQVSVVVLTNGDANKWSAFGLAEHLILRPGDFTHEGEVREDESIAAMGSLGVPPERVILLGFPDRGLDQLLGAHWLRSSPYRSPFTRAAAVPYANAYRPGIAYTGEDLTALLADIIAQARPTIVLAHSAFDEHPDHRAAGEFTTRALDIAGAHPRRYDFLIHAEGFPEPRAAAPSVPLAPPDALRLTQSWLSFELEPALEDLKRGAVRTYKSQYLSPFLRGLLEGFIRPNELFLAPR